MRRRAPFWTSSNMLSDILQDLADEGLQLLGEHLVLVVSAILIAAAIAIPLGVAVAGHPRTRGLALGIANIGQTIPSLALFGFLIPIPFIGGIGAPTSILALVLYSPLPILRETGAGIMCVCSPLRDLGVAVGSRRRAS